MNRWFRIQIDWDFHSIPSLLSSFQPNLTERRRRRRPSVAAAERRRRRRIPISASPLSLPSSPTRSPGQAAPLQTLGRAADGAKGNAGLCWGGPGVHVHEEIGRYRRCAVRYVSRSIPYSSCPLLAGEAADDPHPLDDSQRLLRPAKRRRPVRSPICHQVTSNMRDWAALGDGPAGLIAERVLAYDIADYVRFRAVCHAWRRSSADPLAHSGLDRRFHPWRWTMLQEKLTAPDRRSFLNTSTAQCVQVDVPELGGHKLLAVTPEGLLVLVCKTQHATVRLLNPLTRHLTELPPLTTLLPLKHHDKLSQNNIHIYCAAWGSGIANDDSTVVLCFNSLCMLGMAKPGDDHWTLLDYKDYSCREITMAPLMFAGRFYCVNLSGGVMVLEMGADQPPQLKVAVAVNLSMLAGAMGHSVHLVNNCGELMLVHRLVELTSGNKHGWWYDTYRVDLDIGTLLPVKSLGSSEGRAVFMGMHSSLSVSVECFPSGSIGADTIYLSFHFPERHLSNVGGYHLTDGIVGIPCSLVPRPHTLVDCLSLSNTVVDY